MFYSKLDLSPDSIFTVKSSFFLNMFIAICLYFFAITIFVYFPKDDFILGAFAIIPAIILTVVAFRRRTIMTIDKTGFYFLKDLVTDWDHFYHAHLKQVIPEGSDTNTRDCNLLILEYYKGSTGDLYKMTIGLTVTQDKSEEAILAAIDYFYELSKLTHKKHV
ncbi:MAG: hypothetical protein ABI402_01855 [Ferruginibacter sp.]